MGCNELYYLFWYVLSFAFIIFNAAKFRSQIRIKQKPLRKQAEISWTKLLHPHVENAGVKRHHYETFWIGREPVDRGLLCIDPDIVCCIPEPYFLVEHLKTVASRSSISWWVRSAFVSGCPGHISSSPNCALLSSICASSVHSSASLFSPQDGLI